MSFLWRRGISTGTSPPNRGGAGSARAGAWTIFAFLLLLRQKRNAAGYGKYTVNARSRSFCYGVVYHRPKPLTLSGRSGANVERSFSAYRLFPLFEFMETETRTSICSCRLVYLIYLVSVFMAAEVDCASIPWTTKGADSPVAPTPSFSGVWYFQAGARNGRTNNVGRFFASDNLPSTSTKCDEPKNLPEQFMDWFRESTTDPTIFTLTLAGGNIERPGINSQSLDALIAESEMCSRNPSADSEATTMERSLCPWEWRLNRDEGREPKLISEARCLCRRSRGPMSAADCVPIQREFPVLRRVYCDEHGNYQYVKSYETITVGCHSVMPRTARAVQAPWLLRPKEV